MRDNKNVIINSPFFLPLKTKQKNNNKNEKTNKQNFHAFGYCFRTLAVILVSDIFFIFFAGMIGFSCSYTFVPPSDDSWGQKLNNGQWDGPIGMLTRKVPTRTLHAGCSFVVAFV